MEFNAMDVMFGQELPHMGLMGQATSGQFIDPGLDYASLGYPQIQVAHQSPLRSRLCLQSFRVATRRLCHIW